MFHKPILILFLFFSLKLSAQSHLDSLYRVWIDSSQIDSVRLNAINELSYGNGIAPDSIAKIANEMTALAKRIDSERYVIDANIQLARAFLKMRKLDEALELSTEVFNEAKKIGYRYGQLRAQAILGITLANKQKSIEGLEYLNDAYREITTFQKMTGNTSMFGEIKSYSINKFIGDLQNMMGEINRGIGSYLTALENYEISMRSRLLDNDRLNVAASKNNIGLVYYSIGENDKALKYFEEALSVFEEFEHSSWQGNALGNIANVYMNQNSLEKAEEYMLKNLEIQKNLDPIGEGHSLLSLSNLYIVKKEFDKAKVFADRGEKTFAQYGATPELTLLKMYQGHIAMEKGEFSKAISLFQESSQLADQINSLDLKANTQDYLYSVNKKSGNLGNALAFHEELMILNDSLKKDETSKRLLKVELTNKFFADSLAQQEEKRIAETEYQKEILEQKNTRNVLIGSGLLLLVLTGGLWNRLAFSRKSRKIIQAEKDKSEHLLLNILPAEVAEELKANGEAKARDFELVTVIFSDFKGFTQTSEKLTANELVDELNHCFKGFDVIMEKYNVEKIKTIGDSYMAVGGLNDKSNNSTIKTIQAALEMQRFIKTRNKERRSKDLFTFEMRLGMNSGPVVAGIVGVKKFQYDIWGDTVNTASRLESSGEVGKVNISKNTYELIKENPQFNFTNRGMINVKGKGEIEMFFVELA